MFEYFASRFFRGLHRSLLHDRVAASDCNSRVQPQGRTVAGWWSDERPSRVLGHPQELKQCGHQQYKGRSPRSSPKSSLDPFQDQH